MSNNSDIPLKIFAVLVESDKPLGRKEICSICSIQPQLFDYWISSLIKSNVILLLDRKKYTIHKIFKDKELPALIIPLIKKIASEIPIQNEEQLEDSVSSNLSLYMRYLSEDI